MNWTPDQIVQATGGRLLYGPSGACFDGVGIDSRNIGRGQVFVAIRGATHDGHAFVAQVVQMGVKAIVVAQQPAVALQHDLWQSQGVTCVAVADTTAALGALAAFQRSRAAIPVVAITGSNGKTSTRQMTTLVMEQGFNTLSTQGNFNNEIGLPLTLFHLTADHQAAVLELGMNHYGEISRLGAICRPTIGVITNVGPAHLEFLGSLEGVARAKGELLAQVATDGTVVLNRDDPLVAALAGQSSRRVLFFGQSAEAAVRAQRVVESDRGVSFELVLPGGRTPVALNTPGRFMVSNALAAASVGHLNGLSAARIKAGLETFAPGKGRLQVIATAKGIHLIDDTYNANPASMAAAFETLQALRKDSPAWIVLGDMRELGAQAVVLHREVGHKAAKAEPERLYAHGPNADAVLQGARSAGMSASRGFSGSKEAIVQDLIGRLEPGAWVLVKGSRGMAMETVVKAIREWADRS
jgi:UDP-N-acetylmuramoyl-tripeptide--D-alanyl-D-alanine ligase